FGAVLLVGTTAKAGRQTHLHLGINAAWKFRVRMEVFHASSHFEKIERVVHELFRRHPRSKRPVVNVCPWKPLSRNPSQPRGDRSTGIFVFQMKLEQRSKAQPQAIRVGFGKSSAQDLIKDESRFEVGAG